MNTQRAEIAEYCRSHSIKDAIQHFGVSHNVVLRSCSEHGVANKQGRRNIYDNYGIAKYSETHTIKETAQHFGVSVQVVYAARSRYGKSEKRRSKYNRFAIAEYCETHSIRDAAQHFGVDYSVVHNACSKYSVKPKATQRVACNQFLILKLLLEDNQTHNIVKHLNVRKEFVRKTIKQARDAGFKV